MFYFFVLNDGIVQVVEWRLTAYTKKTWVLLLFGACADDFPGKNDLNHRGSCYPLQSNDFEKHDKYCAVEQLKKTALISDLRTRACACSLRWLHWILGSHSRELNVGSTCLLHSVQRYRYRLSGGHCRYGVCKTANAIMSSLVAVTIRWYWFHTVKDCSSIFHPSGSELQILQFQYSYTVCEIAV